MDKPAERLTREKQFRVRVPIGAIFTTTIILITNKESVWGNFNGNETNE